MNVSLDQLIAFSDGVCSKKGVVAVSDIRQEFGVSDDEAKKLLARMIDECGWERGVSFIPPKNTPSKAFPKKEQSAMSKDFNGASPDIVLGSARYLVGLGYGPVSAGALGALLDMSTASGEKWIAAILKHFPDEWEANGDGISPKHHKKA